MSLTRQLATVLAPYLAQNKSIVLALSGGIDSMVLLDGLAQLELDKTHLQVVHVHHGLSAHADAWLDFCQQQCQDYGIRFSAKRVVLSGLDKGVEAAARSARYAALSEFVCENTVLLTAQHQDDQAETLMLALKRGSGVRGLAAMPLTLPFSQGLLLRPLLAVTRSQIEAYAHQRQLTWVEDDSNSDQHFERNFLRLEVLPVLNKRWPSFNANVARSAQLCQQANQLLDDIAQEDLALVVLTSDSLCLTALAKLSTARCNNVLRHWLRGFKLDMPSQAVLAQMLRQMFDAKSDSDPVVHCGEYTLRRYQQAIFIVPPMVDVSAVITHWNMAGALTLSGNLGFLQCSRCVGMPALRAPLVNEQVTVRYKVTGSDKAAPTNRDKRRTVKKLLQEHHIPTWQRQQRPYLFYNEQLVAAIGLWIDKQFIASNEQDAIAVNWYKN